jgi:predicted NBD/HSP70 family sugar kinase
VPTIASPSTARELRPASLLKVLRAVHDSPVPPTRAMVTSQLRLGRGTAAVLVADLKERRLLAEADAGSRHRPGRPTAQLVPHPEGPLVLSAVVTHDGWTLDTVELGGGTVRGAAGRHDRRRGTRVLDAIAAACRQVVADLPGRVGAFALSLPATVRRGGVAQAALLGWADVDALAPFRWLDTPLGLVNDATAAGIGEARRGAARGHDVVLHLHADAGIGGTLLIGGVPVRDAQGAGGEFGHMPLAGGDRPCRCGAHGCWDLDVGNLALAGTDADADSAGRSVQRAAARVLTSAQAGDPAALARVSTVATKLGRGIGALVNAHDPELVTLSGGAAMIAALAPDPLRTAYLSALMLFRRSSPPPIRTSALDGDGQRLGTAEVAFDGMLTEALVR